MNKLWKDESGNKNFGIIKRVIFIIRTKKNISSIIPLSLNNCIYIFGDSFYIYISAKLLAELRIKKKMFPYIPLHTFALILVLNEVIWVFWVRILFSSC